MDSCKSTGVETSNHFPDVTKMVKLGSGAKRSIQDYMFTRYACYLIAQNGDSKKKLHLSRVILLCKRENRNLLKIE